MQTLLRYRFTPRCWLPPLPQADMVLRFLRTPLISDELPSITSPVLIVQVAVLRCGLRCAVLRCAVAAVAALLPPMLPPDGPLLPPACCCSQLPSTTAAPRGCPPLSLPQGELDPLVPAGNAPILAAALTGNPQVVLHVVPGAAHTVAHQELGWFVSEVEAFLGMAPAAAATAPAAEP